MNNHVTCPHCGKIFEMTQAISHLVEKQKKEFENDREKIREEARKWREAEKIRLEEEITKKNKQIEKDLKEKIKREMELELKDRNNEVGELKKHNELLKEQLLDVSKSIRQIKNERDQVKLESEKKLMEAEEKIKTQAKENAEKEFKFKILELEKQRQDAIKIASDWKSKFEQGSQQLQGDVMEIELKNILKREFPFDEIKDVPTGIKGADVLQIVKNNYGGVCGTIVWELKRTKIWSEGWIGKLKEDKRQIKADLAVIISQVLPTGVKNFSERNGVIIGSFEMITAIGVLLRDKLIELTMSKASLNGKEEKKEILWNYLKGKEFFQRLEAISDAYSQLQSDLEIEKRWFTRKWAKQEKNIRSVIDNILGVHGDLQHIVGRELPEMKGFDILPSGEEDKKDTLF